MANVNGGTIKFVLRGDDQNLSKMINAASNNAQTLAKSFSRVVVDARQTTVAARMQQNAMLGAAQAQARLAMAQGNSSQAAKILQSALGQVNNQSIQSINAQTQLARIQNNAAQGANTLANNLRGAAKELGIFGALFVAGKVGDFVTGLIAGANELEKQKALVRALSKDQAQYNSTIALATTQQQKFGGSLTENLRSLGAFLNLSQRTGVELAGLENLARRLALVDPIQGFEGAAVALKEFFSGDITSLSRRFEIPRSVLNGLKDIEDPIERFKELDKVVSDLGFSQKVLESATQTTAIVYDRLGASIENAKNAVGSYLAEILKIPAQVVTEVILKRVAEDLPQALPENVDAKKLAAQEQFLTLADNVTQFNVAVQFANRTMDQAGLATATLIGHYNELTAAQFAAAKAAIANGASTAEVAARLNELGPTLDKLGVNLDFVAQMGYASSAATEDLKSRLFALALSSNEGAVQAQNLANAWFNNQISLAELQVALRNIEVSNAAVSVGMQEAALSANLAATGGAAYNTQLQALGISTKDAAGGVTEYNTALTEEISKTQEAREQSARLAEINEYIARIAGQVSAGLITKAQAAIQLGNAFGFATVQAEGLIDAELRLASVGDRLKAGQGANTFSNVRGGKNGGGAFGAGTTLGGGAPGRSGTGDVDAVIRNIEQQQKAAKELADSERALAIAQGGRAVEMNLLRQDLSKLKQGTVEYNNTLADLSRLEQQESKANKGKGGGASPRLSAQEKLNNTLLSNKDSYEDKIENSERDHQEKLLDIQNEFAAKQLESQKKQEISKRASRADFYDKLINSDAKDQERFAAQYEAAFAEAQQIAQSGQLELSQKVLAARQQQIEAAIDFESAKQAIQEDEKLTGKEKKNKIAAIEAINRLREDQRAEELKQIREGGDDNVNELNTKLNEEAARYAAQADEIGIKAEQIAERRIASWQRTNQKIAAEGAAELTAFGGLGTGITPPGATGSTLGTSAQPLVTTTPNGESVLGSEQAMGVRIVELAFVRDEGVISELGILGSRLESKLDELRGAIAEQTNNLGGKIDGVASAVRNIKFPSVVR